tara:strand:+ start:2715 stop:3305 length:591 start_codon:yes stop_codon:yes gene_type:complete
MIATIVTNICNLDGKLQGITLFVDNLVRRDSIDPYIIESIQSALNSFNSTVKFVFNNVKSIFIPNVGASVCKSVEKSGKTICAKLKALNEGELSDIIKSIGETITYISTWIVEVRAIVISDSFHPLIFIRKVLTLKDHIAEHLVILEKLLKRPTTGGGSEYNYIYDPDTNDKVDVNSATGAYIVQQYIKAAGLVGW